MSEKYSLGDVRNSFQWLGHKAYTELNAFHPRYKRGDFEWNRENKSFPVIWYTRKAAEVVRFVVKYSASRTVCYGINPRPRIFKKDSGYVRSALEDEIEISQNLLFDFDLESAQITKAQIFACKEFFKRTEGYFRELGLLPPVRAFTGRGIHLLFAYPEIMVKEHQDIGERLKEFRCKFCFEHKRNLDSLELKLDKTQDLRRMVRIYGTAKPDVGIVSRFYGQERIEDEALRGYLLRLALPEPEVKKGVLKIGSELPQWFQKLLETDKQIHALWSGTGKPGNTDRSRSGFDYSLAKRLIWLGYRNIDELATILALRPDAGVREKGEQYIRRTIGKAILTGN